MEIRRAVHRPGAAPANNRFHPVYEVSFTKSRRNKGEGSDSIFDCTRNHAGLRIGNGRFKSILKGVDCREFYLIFVNLYAALRLVGCQNYPVSRSFRLTLGLTVGYNFFSLDEEVDQR